MKKLKVGDSVFSSYYNADLVITRIDSDTDWWFRRLPDGPVIKAVTPLSFFEERRDK